MCFGIDQQGDNRIVSELDGIPEAIEGGVAAAAADEFPAPRLCSGRVFERGQECVHALAESRLGVPAIAFSLHVDRNPAHGLAPNTPMRHRSPSR